MAIQYRRENPFRDCADPGSAIPSAACDRALAALEQAVFAQRNPIVLLGPVGAGKTLLLRRMADQPPPSIRTVFLPWLNVPGEDVVRWIQAFEGTEGSEDDFVAAAREFHARGLRTLLLVDEAQSMPRESAQRLAELAGGAERAVQVILAGIDGHALRAAVAAFPGLAEYVELIGEVTPQEVATWVHHTLDADQLSLLRDLDWVELVQKVKGVPRLVRWELERRLATGDLGAVLSRNTVEPLGVWATPTPAAKSEEPVELPTARASPRAAVAARSVLLTRLTIAHQQLAILLGRLTDRFRRLALWSGEACRKAGGAGRRHSLLLGQALSQAATQFRDAVPSLTESVRCLVIDRTEGVVARWTAVLRNARIWSAHYRTKLVLTGRRATPAIAEVARSIGALLTRMTLAAGRSISHARAAFRGAVRGRGELVAELARMGRGPPSLPPDRKGAGAPQPMLAWRNGSLAVFAIVAAVAFLLGRVTAPPTAWSRAREIARPPAIVSSGPPAAPLGGQDPAITPQPRGGEDAAHERASQSETKPFLPVPVPSPHPEHAVHTAPARPKHILVRIEAHPRARIWIDGHDVGRTPLAGVSLAPGRHHFQIAFADGRKIHRTVEVRHGTHVVKFS